MTAEKEEAKEKMLYNLDSGVTSVGYMPLGARVLLKAIKTANKPKIIKPGQEKDDIYEYEYEALEVAAYGLRVVDQGLNIGDTVLLDQRFIDAKAVLKLTLPWVSTEHDYLEIDFAGIRGILPKELMEQAKQEQEETAKKDLIETVEFEDVKNDENSKTK